MVTAASAMLWIFFLLVTVGHGSAHLRETEASAHADHAKDKLNFMEFTYYSGIVGNAVFPREIKKIEKLLCYFRSRELRHGPTSLCSLSLCQTTGAYLRYV